MSQRGRPCPVLNALRDSHTAQEDGNGRGWRTSAILEVLRDSHTVQETWRWANPESEFGGRRRGDLVRS